MSDGAARTDNDRAPYRICLVCSGNICRSPMAESVLRQEIDRAGLAERVEVDSAGTGDWHVGHDADPRALLALRNRGYPLRHRARQFDPAWFAERDLILALDSGHVRALRRLAPNPATAARIRLLLSFDPASHGGDVPDPYYGGAEEFEHVLDLVERAAHGVVEEVRRDLAGR